MKRNTKGFTLIELLAVIVVLAIIALIATPIVLNLINQAREGAAESSSTAYIKAVENSVLVSMLDDNSFALTDKCTVSEKTVTCPSKTFNVDVDGTVPKAGTITFVDGGITEAEFTNISGYKVSYANGVSDAKGKAE